MGRNGIESIIGVIEVLRRDIDPVMPIQQGLVFFTVCLNEGITMAALSEKLDMPLGSVSRNLKALSKYQGEDRHGSKVVLGADVVRLEPDIENRRALASWLTPKGKKVLTHIKNIIGE